MDTLILIPKDESRTIKFVRNGMAAPLSWFDSVSLKDSTVLSNGSSEVVYYRYKRDSSILSNGNVYYFTKPDKIYSTACYEQVYPKFDGVQRFEYTISDEDFE